MFMVITRGIFTLVLVPESPFAFTMSFFPVGLIRRLAKLTLLLEDAAL